MDGTAIDPYVIVYDGAQAVLRTSALQGVREASWRNFRCGHPGVHQPRASRDGQPPVCEIWDDNDLGDAPVRGFAVYPAGGDAAADVRGERTATYTASIVWYWRGERAAARPGFARVTVRSLERSAGRGRQAGSH